MKLSHSFLPCFGVIDPDLNAATRLRSEEQNAITPKLQAACVAGSVRGEW